MKKYSELMKLLLKACMAFGTSAIRWGSPKEIPPRILCKHVARIELIVSELVDEGYISNEAIEGEMIFQKATWLDKEQQAS